MKTKQTAQLLANPHDQALPPAKLPPILQYAGIGIFLFLLLVVALLLFGEHWRRGTFTLGVAMLWLAVLRLSCDGFRLGVLSIRSRSFDALFASGLGAAIMFFSYSIDSLGS